MWPILGRADPRIKLGLFNEQPHVMKALWFKRYGDAQALSLVERDTPLPREGEVQVRVHAASCNPLDQKILSGKLRWMVRDAPPRGLGSDFSGVVSAIGDKVTGWRVGEAVFGTLDPWRRQGAFAEFVAVGANAITRKPNNVSFEAAATLGVAGGTAIQALLDHAQASAGQRVLLLGASGGVGTFALQLARYLKLEVTAVCSADNALYVRDLGARHVLDYARDDYRSLPEPFDIVFDAAAAASFARCKALLKPKGTYITTVPTLGAMVRSATSRVAGGKRVRPFVLKRNLETLDDLAALAAKGVLVPQITRMLHLADLPDYLASANGTRVAGKTVVKVA